MLLLVSSVKLVAEVALLALVGRGALGWLIGDARRVNVFYLVLSVVTNPVVAITRKLTPAIVVDAHLPWVAGLWLVFAWIGALALKVQVCLSIGMALCR